MELPNLPRLPLLLSDGEEPELLSVDGKLWPVGRLCPMTAADDPPRSAPDFFDRVGDYAASAVAMASAGKKALLLDRFPSLMEARLAMLGARQPKLPILIRVAGNVTELSALLCLQALGAAGFGIPEGEPGWESRLLPYANIPLLGKSSGADLNALLEAGFRVIEGHALSADEWAKFADIRYAPLPRIPRPEDSPLLPCGENGVYYLDENFTASEPIPCEMDMSAAILEMEDTGVDVLRFAVEDMEDAEYFGGNVHMIKDAVCIRAGSEEALEAALLFYPGRALIDSRSDVPEDRMRFLAEGYGAIIR